MPETPTAAEKLAAIDIVLAAPDIGPLRVPLGGLRARIEQRVEHDRAIGLAYSRCARRGDAPDDPATLGALIRAAVESTGATITDPPPARAEEDHHA
ncbi:hypothetical protein IU487_22210 [Nocardia puris]|uniref:hypothetical protein n=1 Tax=Nocardia puris TaxID=208602 RepID=UPI0018939275|nr:hypothetical protein [Nocardia puris]MBF6213734.1 hypothetical protein [Nocardia puris]